MYCEVRAKATGFWGNKVTVTVDFGQPQKRLQQEPSTLVDPQTSKPLAFNSVVAALNHMESKGWEVVHTYVVTEGRTQVCRYLMRRQMPNATN